MTHEHFQTATLAGGCFWCVETIFERLRGVESVTSGYTGGGATSSTRPTSKNWIGVEYTVDLATGHVEARPGAGRPW